MQATLPFYLSIAGPTAAGKTANALASAREFDCEIISVDSALVYRGMDIGTAKPSAHELAAVPHHLIDIRDPLHAYNAAEFAREAAGLIRAISARGKLPLLVGGTMLYFKSLREGLSDLPQADPQVRAALDERATAIGWPAMHAALAKVDPVTASRLNPGDAQRIQRALEVHQLTGVPLSQLQGRRSGPEGLAANHERDTACHPIALSLVPSERSVLHRRIEARFDAMLRAGLVDELRELRRRHALRADMPSMRTVGDRQAWAHLDGAMDAGELRDRGIFATRQLAKRQLTWLRSTPDTRSFDCLAPDLAKQVRDHIQAQMDTPRS